MEVTINYLTDDKAMIAVNDSHSGKTWQIMIAAPRRGGDTHGFVTGTQIRPGQQELVKVADKNGMTLVRYHHHPCD